ncbi:unnamed protein product [Bathycoccus prasinos]
MSDKISSSPLKSTSPLLLGKKNGDEFVANSSSSDDDDASSFTSSSEEEEKEEKKKRETLGVIEFLSNVGKLLETREGIDKTLKTLKYSSVLTALVLVVSRTFGAVFSRREGGRNKRSSKSRERTYKHALEFLALFTEAVYYFLEQGVWLQNVGVFRPDDPVKRKELKMLAMKVEFFMYATSIPLRMVEWRDIERLEKAMCVKKKNEAIAYERSMSPSTRFLAFISSPQKRGVDERREKEIKDEETAAFAKANAIKSVVKDALDLVLVTSDLEWIREQRARDFVANEWVYSTLSLSSALISISKLWAKTLRV